MSLVYHINVLIIIGTKYMEILYTLNARYSMYISRKGFTQFEDSVG